MFAKLYDSEKCGQILVKIDTDPDECNPEVRFYIQPEGFGVCAGALGFKDTDEGWKQAESIFESITFEKAEEIIGKMFDHLPLEGLRQ